MTNIFNDLSNFREERYKCAVTHDVLNNSTPVAVLKPTGDVVTGKSLSEALIFASTNPQYDNRLFIELQVEYMKIPSSKLGRTWCVQKLFLTFRTIFVQNMFSPCSA